MNSSLRNTFFLLLCLAPLPALRAQESEASIFERASQALSAGQYADAEHGFERVLVIDPRNIPALGNLGVIYARTHRFARAMETYQQALKLDPENEPLTLNAGLAYLKQEDYARARPCFQKLVSHHPEDTKDRILLATSMILGDSPQAGLDLLRTAEQRDGNTGPSTLYLLAVAYARTGQMDAGRQIFERLLDSASTRLQANYLLGQAFYDGHRFEQAEQALREVLAQDPGYPGAHRQLGKIYISMHREADAEKELRAAIAADAKDFDAIYFLGALLVQDGRYPEGISYLEGAKTQMPDSWAIPFYLGKAHLKLRQPETAVLELKQAAALNADEPSVFYLLASALRASNHPEEAKQAMGRVEELHSTALEAEKAAVRSRIAGSR